MSKRILMVALFATATIIIFISRFYYGVQQIHWHDIKDAQTAAATQAGVVEIHDVQTYNGDTSYTVVTGANAQGEKLIVWLGAEETHVEKASAGISADQAQAGLLKKAADAQLLRVVPGKLRGDYVWELFYKRPEPSGGERYYYDYVKFADGAHIDTLRLSVQ